MAAPSAASSTSGAIRGATRRPTSPSAASTKNAASAARRGASKTGSISTGEVPSEAGSAPSLSQARTPKAMAQTVANPR